MNNILLQNKDKIIELYHSDYKQKEIAKMFNVSNSSIQRFLSQFNICNKVIFSDKDIENIIYLYKNNKYIYEIAQQYHVSEKRISNLLKDNNIKINYSFELNKKYTLNEHYFDKIDDQNKAYILGLLYADGNNDKNQKISISLQESDVKLLLQINNLIGSNRKLNFINYNKISSNFHNQYRLVISNKYFANQLNSLGVIPNKSLILTFPDFLNEEFYSHFIRGYFDGDGYVSKNIHNAKLTIIGTNDFCLFIKDYCKKYLNINFYIYLCHKNTNVSTRTLQLSGKRQIKIFLDYIYNNSILYLERKHDIYKNLYNIDNSLSE